MKIRGLKFQSWTSSVLREKPAQLSKPLAGGRIDETGSGPVGLAQKKNGPGIPGRFLKGFSCQRTKVFVFRQRPPRGDAARQPPSCQFP